MIPRYMDVRQARHFFGYKLVFANDIFLRNHLPPKVLLSGVKRTLARRAKKVSHLPKYCHIRAVFSPGGLAYEIGSKAPGGMLAAAG
jgi:hypothetical protein